MCGGGGGFISDLGSSISDSVSDARSTLNEIKDTTKSLTVDLPVSLVKAGGIGAQRVLSDPKALTSIGAGIATGGVSTGLEALTGAGAGGFDLNSIISGFLGGGASRPAAAPSVSVVSSAPSPGDYAAPGQGKVPVWVWIVGGVVAVAAFGFLAIKAFGGKR